MSDPAAQVYARALFQAAQAEGRLDAVHRDLTDAVAGLVGSPELVRVLFNPAVDPQAKGRVLRRLTDQSDRLVTRSLLVLLDHGRLGLMPDLQEEFAALYDEATDRVEVQLTTAIPIEDGVADILRRQLEQATGQTVALTRVVDPEILGGVVLRVHDSLVDASVRRRLEGLRRSLKNTRLPA